MCGITGVLNLTNQTPIDPEGLRLANESLFHRGPDDEGMLVEPNFGMAMRRLAIRCLWPKTAIHRRETNEFTDLEER